MAVQAMMHCLGYAGHEGTPMFSARLGIPGPAIVFLGSISGHSLDQYLDATQAYLERRGLPGEAIADCKARATELMRILLNDSEESTSP